MKYVIREVSEPEWSFYFDGDMFNENSGDYCNTLFDVNYDYGRYYSNLNKVAYDEIAKECRYVLDEVYDINKSWSAYKNIKEVMKDYKLKYTPQKAHALKVLAEQSKDFENADTLAKYLTIKTGKEWDTYAARGYCQGDYTTLVYCTKNYTDKNIQIIGDAYFGCGREFGVLEFDENGEEIDSCYGYFVTDSETYEPLEYKRIVCEWAGLDEKETELQLISDTHICKVHDYTSY